MIPALRIIRSLASVLGLLAGGLALLLILQESRVAGRLAVYAHGLPHVLFLIAPGFVMLIAGTICHFSLRHSPGPQPERRLANWLIVTGWTALLAAATIIPFCESTGTS